MQYSDEELLRAIEKCYEKHGKITYGAINDDPELPHDATIRRRFGDMKTAVEKSNVNERYSGTYTIDELKEIVEEKQQKYGYISTEMLKNDDDLPSRGTLIYRFGSISNGREELGMDTYSTGGMLGSKYCNLELVGYEEAPVHTYTITVSNGGHTGIYVGVSEEVIQRLYAHDSNFKGSMPTNEGYTIDNDYSMIGIVDITPHQMSTENRDKIREVERKYFVDQVRKFDTYCIGGGT